MSSYQSLLPRELRLHQTLHRNRVVIKVSFRFPEVARRGNMLTRPGFVVRVKTNRYCSGPLGEIAPNEACKRVTGSQGVISRKRVNGVRC